MKIFEDLNINLNCNENICFIGAGGKTTAMFTLANELKALDKKVLITTSTAIYYPEETYIDEVIVSSASDFSVFQKPKEGSITVLGKEVNKDNKLIGVNKELIDSIYYFHIYDFILNEGDGSKRKPIKAPASYEPVIPISTTKVIGVIGLDSIGEIINEENVHRCELFCNIAQCHIGELINIEMLLKLILHNDGLFKNTPLNAERFLLLNKADNLQRKEYGQAIKTELNFHETHIEKVLIRSLLNKKA